MQILFAVAASLLILGFFGLVWFSTKLLLSAIFELARRPDRRRQAELDSALASIDVVLVEIQSRRTGRRKLPG
jgi:hypothetical protein